jgi:ornithine--oxo-acid transaminase
MTVDPAVPSRLIDQESRYGAAGRRPWELVCTRADGAYVWDVQGNRYLDGFAGGGAVSQGHNHTRIAAAMVEQCLRLGLPARNLRNDRLPPLLEKLCTLAGYERALLLCTGAEAVEAALRAARKWGYRQRGIPSGQAEVIVFQGNTHGGGSTLVSCCGHPDCAEDYGPLAPGFRLVPFGDLEAVAVAAGPATCAVLVEPVQAGPGVVIPPRGFLKGLRELCDRRRILLLADETQSGLGRTGKLLACDHEGVRPDGVVLGQALSGGFYPVSAFLAAAEVLDPLTLRGHDSPFGGNPLACAVATAALDVLVDEKLVERAAELGAYLLERLRGLAGPRIREVRGAGLWAGIELRREAGSALAACDALRREGLLCGEDGGSTLVLAPPLVITREQLDWILDRLAAVLERSA